MADEENARRTSDQAQSGAAMRDRPNPSRRQFLATGATVSATALVGCIGGGGGGDEGTTSGGTTTKSTPVDYPDEVVIGSVHPFTGSTSYVGQRLHWALELAATMKNENGGIQSMNGAKVRVEKGDHKNDPSVGAEAARELVEQGADVLTGTFSSPVASAVTRVAETEQVPFVIDIAVAASILQERDLNYVYRAQPNSWSQAADHIAGLGALSDRTGIDMKTLGLYYVDNTYGQAIRDGLERAVEGTDFEIVADTAIGFGETADTQVTKLRQADPDVVVPTAFTPQILELTSAMKAQDYWPNVLGACASGGLNPKTYEKIGSVINGELKTGYAIDPNSEKADKINQRFVETYDTAPMTSNVTMAYTTGEFLIEAFETAASADPQTLNETIADITVEDHAMAMPPLTFNENGENANPLSVTKQIQNMENRIIYPEKYAEASLKTGPIGN